MKPVKQLIKRCALNKTASYFFDNNNSISFHLLNNMLLIRNLSSNSAHTHQLQLDPPKIVIRKYSDQIKIHASTEKVSNKATSILQKSSNDKNNDSSSKKWWQTSGEFKILASLVFGLMSYLFTMYTEKRRAAKKVRLDHVNQQIQMLYGPLYGNRLIQQRTYEAVMGKHGGLKNYLKIARETEDAEMLRRWRSFVSCILYPLDKEAETLICKNAHLIVDNEFPQAFDDFLDHIARLQFVMEYWKSQDGKLEKVEKFTIDDFLEENNASGNRGVKEMLAYVEEKFRELKKVQEKLKVEVKATDGGQSITSHITKISKFK